MIILGIETSCDETAVCLIEAKGEGADFTYTVLGNALISQIDIHAPYGGVFPALAKREHEKNLVPLLEMALAKAGLSESGDTSCEKLETILARETELRAQLIPFLQTHTKPHIDAIAVTNGPGLEPALWVGINFAKALAAAWNLPLVPVNHMEGHIVMSAFSNREKSMTRDVHINEVHFPMLSLLISGGHTELVLSKEWMHYELIGQTRDDAVGEAFDKVARLMGLPYPGGPEIDRLARTARDLQESLQKTITLPRPMIDSDNYDFSFSGIKTAVRKIVDAHSPLTEEMKMQIALEFENSCAEVLTSKTIRAIEEYNVKTIVVGGGVSANVFIRESLARALSENGYGTQLLIPPREFATDNALMIALSGYFRASRGEYADADSIRAQGNLKLAEVKK